MPESLIRSGIDFKDEGKFHGYLRLPHSVHRSACGRISVPVFGPFLEPGDTLVTGEATGAIHHPDDPRLEPGIAHSECDGMVLYKRLPCLVDRGDCLFQIATDEKETAL